ncbi:MAG: type VI secretion system protein TssA [Phycisphaerae bacterium]|jgi:type VI secretion system protein VasJ
MLDEQPILDLGRLPVPGTAPAGVDAADDPDYILVNEEMSKADRIDTGPPDWRGIEAAATNLLREKSKDVEIATYLGMALFRREGYDGLAAAFGMILEMINTFWDGMFPERHRRRKARIEALCERFTEGGWFRDEEFKPDNFDALDRCLERITAIEEALKARMADDPPDFAKFKRSLKEYAAQRPKEPAPAPVPASGGEAASTGAPAAAARPAGGGGGAVIAGEVSDRSGAINAIMAGATFIRKADPADPVPYAVVRAVKWSMIALPQGDAARQIPPPEKATVEALTHQFGAALWDNLLKNAEAAFRSSDPLWLDLQRYVCAAMAGLGPNFERARHAVIGATAGLVRRLGSGLFELRFSDGTPLCSGETRLWIESEVSPPAGASGGGQAGNGKLTEAVQKSRELAGAGKLQEALAELHKGLGGCTEQRDRLMWRLQIAGLCFDAQRLQMAHNILEECSEAIRSHHIDEWEPSLAVQVAQTLYRCQRALAAAEKTPSPELLAGMRETYKWLCELDSMAAFAIDPPGK